ncbi:hypothetical protein SMC26_19145 [Actinomadura fulvescens]|uniref:Uncharacterized protein n=1 Tax=Actinomadura fulvescens TaxID=46160 RepID=A0ABP6CVB3_9ACTN
MCPTVVLSLPPVDLAQARCDLATKRIGRHDSADLIATLVAASVLTFGLSRLSAVGGVGGSVLMFTALFGLQEAVPTLALAQLALAGGLLLPHVPAELLKRSLGALLSMSYQLL